MMYFDGKPRFTQDQLRLNILSSPLPDYKEPRISAYDFDSFADNSSDDQARSLHRDIIGGQTHKLGFDSPDMKNHPSQFKSQRVSRQKIGTLTDYQPKQIDFFKVLDLKNIDEQTYFHQRKSHWKQTNDLGFSLCGNDGFGLTSKDQEFIDKLAKLTSRMELDEIIWSEKFVESLFELATKYEKDFVISNLTQVFGNY